ncbi:low affinity immunoglobulin gamma Fc region receptor III-like [Haemorhous mexicanus]|uniref:low affinity immunoglobulin gamma Fc region receptor III-like n=1 Tax=Haemorhous mexicanus TaxID=30427 RepID=UPI0028BD2F62|nr:low affinity immunoglobulin gamma Fc region receptor III-like [Haemorhous mexicanus]
MSHKDTLGTAPTPCTPCVSVPTVPPPPSPVPSPFQHRPSASLVSPWGMPWPHPAVPSPVLALPGWCPLSPTGAQTTQLLVEPPWRPAVLWDPVTLTCQGSGTAGATTWYRDGQRWGQKGGNHFTVTESGTYRCDTPGSRRSPPVTVSNDDLVLQVPVLALLEGDTVTLRCRGWRNRTVTRVSVYREGEKLRGLRGGTKLSLSPLQLHHSGSYRCTGLVGSWVLHESAPVTMTVYARLELQVSARELLEGDTVTLRCLRWHDNPVTGVRFYHGDKEVGRPLNGTELSLSPLQLNHSGNYSCEGWVDSGVSPWAQSAPVTVTVHGEHPLGWNSNLLTPPQPLPSRLRVTVLTSPLLP